jgi:hypothetical protein
VQVSYFVNATLGFGIVGIEIHMYLIYIISITLDVRSPLVFTHFQIDTSFLVRIHGIGPFETIHVSVSYVDLC